MEYPSAFSSLKPKKQKEQPWKKRLYFYPKNSTLNKFFMLSRKFLSCRNQFFYTQKHLFYSMDQPRADIIKDVFYSASLYFLHSKKKCSILILYKISISFTIVLMLFFFFFFSKNSISHSSILALFVFFFLRTILVSFTNLFEILSSFSW